MNNTMQQAGKYRRISYDRTGEELGVQRQDKPLNKIADERGLTVVGDYVDNDISASKDTVVRPGYDRLEADYHAGLFNHVLVWDIDRLTRRPIQLERWIEAGEKRGTRIYTTEKMYDLTNRDDRQFLRFKAMQARNEIDLKSARHLAANKQRREMGKPPMCAAPYGFVRDWSAIDEPKAKVVREIFQRYTHGESLTGIARWLNSTPHKPVRAKFWSQQQIRAILLNSAYPALVSLRGELTGDVGTWPQIVEESVYRKARRRLEDAVAARGRYENRHHKWLGTYFFACGDCGAPMAAHGHATYRCRGENTCLCRSVPPVDEYVRDVIRTRLARPDVAELLPVDRSAEHDAADEEVKTLRERIEQVERDYDDDLIDAARRKRKLDRIRPQLEAAERTLSRYTSGDALAELLTFDDPVAEFDRQPVGVQRSVARSLMTVRLLRGNKGRFDPETVQIAWNHAG